MFFGYLYKLLGRESATGVFGRLTLRIVEWSIGLVGLYFFLRMRSVLPHGGEAELDDANPPGNMSRSE